MTKAAIRYFRAEMSYCQAIGWFALAHWVGGETWHYSACAALGVMTMLSGMRHEHLGDKEAAAAGAPPPAPLFHGIRC